MPSVIEAIDELKRRDEHAINVYKPGDTPDWNQKAFHSSTATYRLLFGGNRSGKSQAAAYEVACWLLGRSPFRSIPDAPNRVWCISVEYSTLYEGIYRHLRNLLPDWETLKKGPLLPGTRLPSYIELKNGSDVVFKSSKGGEEAREKFQAADIDLISIDEEVPEYIIEELELRTLDRAGCWIVSATLVESYEWITNLEILAEQEVPGHFLVRLNTEANPYLDAVTVARIKAKLSQEDLEVRYYGKSRRSKGLVYNTYSDSVHAIAPFKIPLDWPRWRSFDPGIRTAAVLWIAVGPKDDAYAYRELYLHNIPLHEIAIKIKECERWKLNKELTLEFKEFIWEETDEAEHMVESFIDDRRGSRLITGEAGVLDQLNSRYGLSCTPADKSKVPGIEDCRWWLDNKFKVFNTCTNFIWEIKRYRIRNRKTRIDQNEPIDEPVKKDDHLMDNWRYIARSQPKWKDRHLMENMQRREFLSDIQIGEMVTKEHFHEFLGSEW